MQRYIPNFCQCLCLPPENAQQKAIATLNSQSANTKRGLCSSPCDRGFSPFCDGCTIARPDRFGFSHSPCQVSSTVSPPPSCRCCACNRCPICLIRRLCKETWDRYRQQVIPSQERYSVFEGGRLPSSASIGAVPPGAGCDGTSDRRSPEYEKALSETAISKQNKKGKKGRSDEGILKEQIKKKTKKQITSDNESEVEIRKGEKGKKSKKGQLPSETDLNKSTAKGKRGAKGKTRTLEEKSDEDLRKDTKSKKGKNEKIQDELPANKKKGSVAVKGGKKKGDEQTDDEVQQGFKPKKTKKGVEVEDDLQIDRKKDKIRKGGKKIVEDEVEISKRARKGKKDHAEENLQMDKKKSTAVPKGRKKKAEDQIEYEAPKGSKSKRGKKDQIEEDLQTDNKKSRGVSKGGKKKINGESVEDILKRSKLKKGKKEPLVIEFDVDKRKETKASKSRKKPDQLGDTFAKTGKPFEAHTKRKRQDQDDGERYAKRKSSAKDRMKAAKSTDTFGDGDKARGSFKNKREFQMDTGARKRGRNPVKDSIVDKGNRARTIRFSNRKDHMARRSDTDLVVPKGTKYRGRSIKRGYLSDDDTSFDVTLVEAPVKKGKGRILLADDYMRLRLEESDLKRMAVQRQNVVCPPCQSCTPCVKPCPCDAVNYSCQPLECL